MRSDAATQPRFTRTTLNAFRHSARRSHAESERSATHSIDPVQPRPHSATPHRLSKKYARQLRRAAPALTT
ncbi:hypothetical protein C6T53_18635 [Burkholderia multivorans]|nr:hypothetical protein C6T53_18635 [Burkholderia multivorans]